MIHNIQQIGNRVWAKWTITYELSYDETTGKYTCECAAFTFKKPCKHIEQFKQAIKDREIFIGE